MIITVTYMLNLNFASCVSIIESLKCKHLELLFSAFRVGHSYAIQLYAIIYDRYTCGNYYNFGEEIVFVTHLK